MKKIPDYVLNGLTRREWKAKKREQLRQAVAAFSVYRNGCAYCPGTDGEVGIIDKNLDSLTASHSVRAWGR